MHIQYREWYINLAKQGLFTVWLEHATFKTQNLKYPIVKTDATQGSKANDSELFDVNTKNTY